MAHLCAASIIRAMPETEIPPVKRGDIYCARKLLAIEFVDSILLERILLTVQILI